MAGHHGLVGSAIWNNLKARGYNNLVGKSHKELDLLDPVAVKAFFDAEQPDAVVLAAAHVGGIMANLQYRADFIYQNLQIQQNVIGESWKHGVKKLLFLGSTCIYPGEAPQPMPEDCLLTSALEYTNEPYAIAKIAGLKMCESFNLQYGTNYIAVMPTNLYGPNDNFHLENSHVLPAMIRKVYLAKCLNEGDWAKIAAQLKNASQSGDDDFAFIRNNDASGANNGEWMLILGIAMEAVAVGLIGFMIYLSVKKRKALKSGAVAKGGNPYKKPRPESAAPAAKRPVSPEAAKQEKHSVKRRSKFDTADIVLPKKEESSGRYKPRH